MQVAHMLVICYRCSSCIANQYLHFFLFSVEVNSSQSPTYKWSPIKEKESTRLCGWWFNKKDKGGEGQLRWDENREIWSRDPCPFERWEESERVGGKPCSFEGNHPLNRPWPSQLWHPTHPRTENLIIPTYNQKGSLRQLDGGFQMATYQWWATFKLLECGHFWLQHLATVFQSLLGLHFSSP